MPSTSRSHTTSQTSQSVEALGSWLVKASGHKYLKREGTPGNYRYTYPEEAAPTGSGSSEGAIPQVGVTWESREGSRKVVGSTDTHVLVTTGDSPLRELIPKGEFDRRMDYDKRQLASRNQAKAQVEAQAKKETDAKFLHGFEAQFSPMQAAKVVATLNQEKSVRRELLPLKTHIERFVADGWRVQRRDGKPARLVAPDGAFFDEKALSSTAFKYAEFLADQGGKVSSTVVQPKHDGGRGNYRYTYRNMGDVTRIDQGRRSMPEPGKAGVTGLPSPEKLPHQWSHEEAGAVISDAHHQLGKLPAESERKRPDWEAASREHLRLHGAHRVLQADTKSHLKTRHEHAIGSGEHFKDHQRAYDIAEDMLLREPKVKPKREAPIKSKQLDLFGKGLSGLQDWLSKSGGPFIGPRGGKWADAAHTVPWGDDPEAVNQVKNASHEDHAKAVHLHQQEGRHGIDTHYRLQHIPAEKLDAHIALAAGQRDHLTHNFLMSQRNDRLLGGGQEGRPLHVSRTREQMETLRPAVEHWARNTENSHYGSRAEGTTMMGLSEALRSDKNYGHFTPEELGHLRAMYADDNSTTGQAVRREFIEKDLKAKSDAHWAEQAQKARTAEVLKNLPQKMQTSGAKAAAAGAHFENLGHGKHEITHGGKTTIHDLSDRDGQVDFHGRLKEIAGMKPKIKKSMAGVDGLGDWLAKSGAEGADLEGLGKQSGNHDSAPGPGTDKNGLAGVPAVPGAGLGDPEGEDLEGVGRQTGNHSGAPSKGCDADGLTGVPEAMLIASKAEGALSPDDWRLMSARKSMTSVQTELHGRERAILRRALEHRASTRLSGDDQAADLAKSEGFYVGGAPTLTRGPTRVGQHVLCKSVHQGGCDASYPQMLSACPECGAGTVQHQPMVQGLAPGKHTRLKLPITPRSRLR